MSGRVLPISPPCTPKEMLTDRTTAPQPMSLKLTIVSLAGLDYIILMTSAASQTWVVNFFRIIGRLRFVLQLFAVALAGSGFAQTLADIGAAAPSPGQNDIYQLSTQG